MDSSTQELQSWIAGLELEVGGKGKLQAMQFAVIFRSSQHKQDLLEHIQ